MVKAGKKTTCSLGLPWWSGGQQSLLPMQRVQVGALVRELITHMQHGIDIKRHYSTATSIKFWTGILAWQFLSCWNGGFGADKNDYEIDWYFCP